MRSDRKQTIIFIIILLVLSLGIGYAFLTTTLSIDGVSDIDASGWNVHFDNLTIAGTSNLPNDQIYTPANISANGKEITFSIKLKNPGDYYIFNFDIINEGTIDAKIDNLSSSINGESVVPQYLDMLVQYSDYIDVDLDQILLAGESVGLFYRIGYNPLVRPEDLPSEDTTLNISLSVDFIQTSINKTLFSKGIKDTVLGEKLTSEKKYYNDYNDLINYSDDVFEKYELDANNIVTDAYIGFVKNNDVYYLKCGKSTYNSLTDDYNNDSPYFEENKNTLLSAFGESNCFSTDNGDGFGCSYIGNYIYRIKKNGYIMISCTGGFSEFLPSGSVHSGIAGM